MTMFYGRDETPLPGEISPGPTIGFAEGFRAAFDEMRAGHTSHSPRVMMREATSERRGLIEAATGKPFAEAVRPFMPDGVEPTDAELGLVPGFDWEPVIGALKASLPAERARPILTGAALEARAGEIAYDIEAEAATARARSRDFAGGAGLFLGELAGRMSDPINMGSLMFGAPAASGLLRFAVTEALIGGASEAALQPFVQKWRGRAGLREVDPALEVAMAAGGAGLVAGGGWIATRAGRAALDAVRGLSPEGLAEAHAELRPAAGDDELAARAIVEQRATVPGAPGDVAPGEHMERIAAAERMVARGERPRQAAPPAPAPAAFAAPAGDGQAGELGRLESDVRAAIEAEGDFEIVTGAREDERGDLVVETITASAGLRGLEEDRAFIDQLRICAGGGGR